MEKNKSQKKSSKVNASEIFKKQEENENLNILYTYATESPFSSSIVRSRTVNLHQTGYNSPIERENRKENNEYANGGKLMHSASVGSISFIQSCFLSL